MAGWLRPLSIGPPISTSASASACAIRRISSNRCRSLQAGDGEVLAGLGGRGRLLVGALENIEGHTVGSYMNLIRQQSYADYGVDYAPRGATWFVLSGENERDVFYEKVIFSCSGRIINSFALIYPSRASGTSIPSSKASRRPSGRVGTVVAMQPADVQVDPLGVGAALPTARLGPADSDSCRLCSCSRLRAGSSFERGRHASITDSRRPQHFAWSGTGQDRGGASEATPRAEERQRNCKAFTGPAPTRPDTPAVRLLNPGTADPQKAGKGALARESRAAPGGTSQPTARSDAAPTKPRDKRSTAPRDADYQDLRDYMLRR